jgi:exopolysaccharide biosynthesis protein
MTLGGAAGRGLTLNEAMLKFHAIAGINAGGFEDPGGDGNGGTPVGLIIINGKLISPAAFIFGSNQVMGVTTTGEWFMGDYSTSYLLAKKVQYAIQFGPELIANGKILVSGTAGWGYAPRTVIGQMSNGSIVFWVNDGRWQNGYWDWGASLGQVAQILLKQGVVNAFNLDGGGSATMMLKSPKDHSPILVNKPDTNNPPYGMRFLPDAFLVVPTK